VAESTGRHAFLVGAGILISRIIGVIRQRVFAHVPRHLRCGRRV
jgi:peptidoglycan biosynthesis protein MviN/MurJ (putative lipid II flippase)